MKILRKFNEAKISPSDINEHLETLRQYASGKDHVTEMGVRGAVSTYAFLAAQPKKLVSYDLYSNPGVEEAIQLAREKGLDFTFHQQDVLRVDIEETDVLFIDTYHCYSQLKQELELHSSKVRKNIILHDTITYRNKDEQGHWVTPEMIANYRDEDKKGLWPAVEEFLQANTNWVIEKEFTNNNGLTILKRVS